MEETYESIFPERPILYAGFGNRLVAVLIDGIILWLVDIPIGLLFNDGLWGSSWYSSIFSLVINILYFAVQESSAKQATIGKKVMGMYVATADGGRISFGQGIIRYFGRLLSGIILFIGYFMMLWDSRKQTLHDKIANTLVLYK